MIDRVAFRVDSGTAIGGGHLARCLAIAAGLAKHGVRSRFVCRAHQGHLCDLVRGAGHETFVLGAAMKITNDPSTWLGATPDEDAKATTDALRDVGPVDWLIADHYGVDAAWHERVRGASRRVMAIDDLANRPLHVDLLLDHNHGATAKPYSRLAPQARLLLGPRYALLDPSFQGARGRARAVTPRPERESRVLISLGGTDPDNVTTWVLTALADDLSRAAALDVVIGRGHPAPKLVEKACQTLPNAVLHVQTTEMADLLANADLAIGAGGVSTLERACLGIPTLALALAPNQVPALRALHRDGLLVHVDRFRDDLGNLRQRYRELVSDHERRECMSAACRRAVDGLGLGRVVDALLGVERGPRGQIGSNHA